MAIGASMWALELTGPSTFETRVVPAPVEAHLQQGEVLLRSLAGGVCGSDLPFFRGRPNPLARTGDPAQPGFPLHEIVGEVVASADAGISVGDRAVGWASSSDGLAEFVVSRGASLHAIAKDLDATIAVMLQPLACVLYAVDQLGDLAGRSVAVLGVGPIGALFAHVVKSRGASRVVGVDRVDRSDVRAVFGLDEVVHADAETWAGALAESERPDVIVEAVGHQVETLTSAVEALAWGGTIFYFGIPNDRVYPFPMDQFLRKNARLISGVTPVVHRRRVLGAADAYVAKHPELVGAYLGTPYSYEDAQSAFEAAAHPRAGQMKVTLCLG
ncbi:zinc-binding dehydrogenase [Cryobacterium tagatosivorans]|nr:zinc-binding dehydrogenase [Cryobacterium tagatosivorans]